MTRAPARSPLPPAVLIDTGAFYALADTGDIHPALAAKTFDDLTEAGTRLFTTEFVVAETHALMLARLRRTDRALKFLTSVYGSDHVAIVDITLADQQRAVALLSRYADKRFSFTDATSFVVMERLDIPRAFTFDRNFTQYGVSVVPSIE